MQKLSKSPGARLAVVPVLISAMALTMVPSSAWAAGEDCELGKRYYQLSSTAKAEYRQEDAFLFLERAAGACPSYQYFQEMAELATEFGDPARDQQAAEAIGEALELASTDKERARSIARYAELLFHGNDPQNAMNYIVEARNLDPDSVWIADLSDEITNRAANVTSDDIKRGLADMAFKPLRLNRTTPVDQQASGGSGAVPTPETTAPARSINISLNFRVNSTELDAATQNNLQVLANTLVEDEFAGQQFLLIGHADVRGSAATNLALSQERAQAIYAAVEALQPSLSGRIKVEGKGEAQPMATGLSEGDHRINRRLEVVLVD